MNVNIHPLVAPRIGELPLEIVERKGIGHPDTICDALAETLSGALCRYYLERFGTILHHNVDKALLCGGAARPEFGGGQLLAPIEIHLGGRATTEFEGVAIHVEEIAIESSRAWLRQHLPTLDPLRDVRIVTHVRPTSPDLAALFRRNAAATAPLANDTSFGVGFAPLTSLETTVLDIERRLNSPATKREYPEIGTDIKVMGSRDNGGSNITVACAFIGRHIRNIDHYFERKSHVGDMALRAAGMKADQVPTVAVNSADGTTSDSVYLTVTGLSAESGDDGQVGRGNRVNGLITPYRPMSLEAAAGKNPVTHVGKLYNIIANRVAFGIVRSVPEVAEAYCYLLSRIGRPISQPQLFDVKVRLQDAAQLDAIASRIDAVARAEFASVDSIWREAVDGTLQVW